MSTDGTMNDPWEDNPPLRGGDTQKKPEDALPMFTYPPPAPPGPSMSRSLEPQDILNPWNDDSEKTQREEEFSQRIRSPTDDTWSERPEKMSLLPQGRTIYTNNSEVPMDVDEEYWSASGNPGYIRQSTPGPDGEEEPTPSNTTRSAATANKRRPGLTAEEVIRRRKTRRLSLGTPHNDQNRESSSQALRHLSESIDQYFETHKNETSAGGYVRASDPAATGSEPGTHPEHDAQEESLESSAPIMIIDDPTDLAFTYHSQFPEPQYYIPSRARHVNTAPVVPSPLNPSRSLVLTDLGVWYAHMNAFRDKADIVSAYRRKYVVPRNRNDCVYQICRNAGTDPNADPRRVKRCWSCQHKSQPYRQWQLQASQRWITQLLIAARFEQLFEEEDEDYDDGYYTERDDIDYSEAYST